MNGTEPSSLHEQIGARRLPDGSCRFRVWAPRSRQVTLHLTAPEDRLESMGRDDHGYHEIVLPNIPAGTRYLFRLEDGSERPDPASRHQPDGVHEASAVFDPSFAWTDAGWQGIPLRDHVFYELHVGTFTKEGTFDAIIPHFASLKDLGVTAIELMPVAQFPGARNWGYDGVYPYAAQHSYGGPDGLRHLVNAAHAAGMAVVLDVVYNHLGPEGNSLGCFAPYFTDAYKTPWGEAINYDGAESNHVRDYFVGNALSWQVDFHLDGLRLDAVHAIRDFSAVPFLEELGVACRAHAERTGRAFPLIAESDMNMARHILPRAGGGYGLDGQWSDDFHHSLHTLLTGERDGYYKDYGAVHHLARVMRDGYTYTGQYSAYRRHRHGSDPSGTEVRQMVVCAQNHDQVGNRMLGDRLGRLVSAEGLRTAAAAMLLSPFVPLLFMGEEYADPAPFLYFTSHGDPGLVEAVRKGRRAEFAAFAWKGELPDPQDPATFEACRLSHGLAEKGTHAALRRLYRRAIQLRRELPALSGATRTSVSVEEHANQQTICVRYREGEKETVVLTLCFAREPVEVECSLPEGTWRRVLDTEEEIYGGSGQVRPETLTSTGSVRWSFAGVTAVLWRRA